MNLFSAVYVFLSLGVLLQASHKLIEHSKAHKLPYVDKLQRAAPHIRHQVVFAVRQNNLNKIESILNDISDPYSTNYGKHLTRAEIMQLTKNSEAIAITKAHLRNLRINVGEESLNSDYLIADAPVKVWEKLFQTEFYHYTVYGVSSDTKTTTGGTTTADNGKQLIRAEHYSLPFELVDHIECVFHTVQFPVPVKRTPTRPYTPDPSYPPHPDATKKQHLRTSSPLAAAAGKHVVNATYNPYYPYVSPALLNYVYNVRSNRGNDQTTQGVYETNQAMNPLDLASFQKYFSLPEEGIALDVGGYVASTACNVAADNNYYYSYYYYYYNTSSYYATGGNTVDCSEANLDVQYLMSMGQHIPTIYYAWNQAEDWLITWILSIANSHDIADVISLSYGGAEQYYARSYVHQFNLEAMKLAAMGVTLVVASGDDGAVGYAVRYSTNYCGYAPDFPSVSPYVTSVGGTMVSLLYCNGIVFHNDAVLL